MPNRTRFQFTMNMLCMNTSTFDQVHHLESLEKEKENKWMFIVTCHMSGALSRQRGCRSSMQTSGTSPRVSFGIGSQPSPHDLKDPRMFGPIFFAPDSTTSISRPVSVFMAQHQSEYGADYPRKRTAIAVSSSITCQEGVS